MDGQAILGRCHSETPILAHSAGPFTGRKPLRPALIAQPSAKMGLSLPRRFEASGEGVNVF